MLRRITESLDELLQNDEWSGIDAAENGLQLENNGEVNTVVFTVDSGLECIEKAKRNDADLMVVHHGLVWGGIERITGSIYKRISKLVKNNIALYSSHLPLDAHPVHGNNVGLLEALDAEKESRWGEINGREVGWTGRLEIEKPMEVIINRLEDTLEADVTVLDFGDNEIQEIAVLTGAGGGLVEEAYQTGADLYITGEPKHRAHHTAKEYGLNVVFGGHYHTERYGVLSLKEWMESEYDVETFYMDIPTKV